ncbi:MAG TPA: DUF6283 family protein [Vicinamibacterales bacterium]|nr:DUF6283 family protein [Vicinamibacterales bacterium]
MRRQCAKCPWRKDVDPRDIPNGYSRHKHAALADTIADPGRFTAGPLRVMACHESAVGAERPCVGWLHNQLVDGNNIALRLAAHRDPSLADIELVGPQHARFEDTLPRTA